MTYGDYMVRRNAANTDPIPNGGAVNLQWDTLVASRGAVISHSGALFTLAEGGNYLVCYSDQWGTTDVTNERLNVKTLLQINTVGGAGRSSGFVRKNSGSQEYISAGFAIINVSPGDGLRVRHVRFDSSTIPPDRIPDRSGVTVLKLNDVHSFGRYRTTSVKTLPSEGSPFIALDWDIADEEGAGITLSTPPSGTIIIADAGRYLVCYTIPLLNAGGGTRSEALARLELDGVAVVGSRAQTYMRDAENALDGCLSWAGIVDIGAGDVLELNWTRSDGDVGGITVGTFPEEQAHMGIWKLPTGNETCIVEGTDLENYNAAATNFQWESIKHLDAAAFTHVAGTQNVDVDVRDDYLAFASMALTTFGLAVRPVPAVQLRVDAVNSDVAGGSSYHRGAQQSGQSAITCGGLLTQIEADASLFAHVDRIGTEAGALENESGQFSILRLGSALPVKTHSSLEMGVSNEAAVMENAARLAEMGASNEGAVMETAGRPAVMGVSNEEAEMEA